MPINDFGDTIQAPAASKNEFGDTIESGTSASAPPERPGYLSELYQQSISPWVKGLKEHPLGTVLSGLGGLLSLIKPGWDPVPESGGVFVDATGKTHAGPRISVTEPTQMDQAVDIAQRGPAAIGAAATLGALPSAARFGLPVAGRAVSTAGQQVVNAATAPGVPEAVGLFSPRAANALRLVRKGQQAVQAYQAGKEAAAPSPAAEGPSPVPETSELLNHIARSRGFKEFASVKDPDMRTAIQDTANRFNSGATPTPSAAGPQLVPKTPSGQDIIRGSSNIPLSRQGYAEAHRLADATAGQWDEIHSSPLDRARETAQIVADVNPQAGPVRPTEALTPWYLGQHEGQPTTAVLDKMQDLIQKPDEVPSGRGPQSTKPGQSFNDFKNEFLGHVQDQIDRYQPGQKILNATHYRDTRVLQAWAKAGAPDDFSIDVPTMMEKGDVKPGDMLRLDPKTMKVEATRDANQPGIYFARHGATEWNAENGTVNPAESAGAPGPRGPASVPPQPAAVPPQTPQVPPEQLARLNAGAPPGPAAGKSGVFISEGENQPRSVYFTKTPTAPAAETGMFLRNMDLDKIARNIRIKLNKGEITKDDAAQIISSKGGVENLRDQLGLKGRYEPGMTRYLQRKVF